MKTYADSMLQNKLTAHLASYAHTQLSASDLFALDQFHLGGPIPIKKLLARTQISARDTILDLGSGLGGASRLMASETGCHVNGVELCDDYVKAANLLSKASDLSNLVTCAQGDITHLMPSENLYDGALLSHVQMNIADKSSLTKTIHSTLKPNAPLMIWEIFAEDPTAVNYPMGWSLDGSDSFLCNADQMITCLEGAGFRIAHWQKNPTWVIEWAENILSNGPPPGLNLPALLIDGKPRLVNMLKGLVRGQLTVVEGLAHA